VERVGERIGVSANGRVGVVGTALPRVRRRTSMKPEHALRRRNQQRDAFKRATPDRARARPYHADTFLLRAAVGNRRRLVIVVVIILITLAVFRVYRIATSKLFLKPAANRLEHSSGSMNNALTEMHDGGTISIRSFCNRSSGLLRR